MKITIRNKMLAGFLVVVSILIITGLVGLNSIKHVDGDMDTIAEQAWPAADAIMEIRINFMEKAFAHSMIIEGEIEEAIAEWDHSEEELQEELLSLKQTGLASDSVINNLEDINNKLNNSRDGLIDAYKKGGTSAVLESVAMKEFDETIVSLQNIFIKLEDEVGISSMNAAIDEAHKTINSGTVTIILVSFLGVILAIGIALFITNLITKPVGVLVAATNAIAAGDLTKEVAVNTSDEIGQLASSFNVMVKGLNAVVSKTQDAVNKITSSGNEILAASQQQASGAREQSSAVSETTSAAEELSTTSEQVGDSIKKVSEVATHALAGMAKIKDTISKTSSMITSLGEKSQQIAKITELIDDVADQTNLLAVNASIEAARAGEQGKGFTVVADEIRKLSDSTAKSTKDITSLIELIQHEMTNSIMSMEQSVKSVDEEAKLAQQTAEKSKEIAMSVNQQISGSKQISDAMNNIDEAMKQIAAGAQQSQAAVKQLTELGTELKDLTSKFKI